MNVIWDYCWAAHSYCGRLCCCQCFLQFGHTLDSEAQGTLILSGKAAPVPVALLIYSVRARRCDRKWTGAGGCHDFREKKTISWRACPLHDDVAPLCPSPLLHILIFLALLAFLIPWQAQSRSLYPRVCRKSSPRPRMRELTGTRTGVYRRPTPLFCFSESFLYTLGMLPGMTRTSAGTEGHHQRICLPSARSVAPDDRRPHPRSHCSTVMV